MLNKKIYFLLLMYFQCGFAGETPRFLEFFYTKVNPRNMPMGLKIYKSPYDNNVNIDFILYNEATDNRNLDETNTYKYDFIKTYKDTSFDVVKDNNNLLFFVKDFCIARVALEDLQKSDPKMLKDNNGRCTISLFYELRGKQLLNYKNCHHQSLNGGNRFLLCWGTSKSIEIYNIPNNDMIILTRRYENGRLTLKKFEDAESNNVICYNYNRLTDSVKVPEVQVQSDDETSSSDSGDEVYSGQPEIMRRSDTYFYVATVGSIFALVLAVMWIKKGGQIF